MSFNLSLVYHEHSMTFKINSFLKICTPTVVFIKNIAFPIIYEKAIKMDYSIDKINGYKDCFPSTISTSASG